MIFFVKLSLKIELYIFSLVWKMEFVFEVVVLGVDKREFLSCSFLIEFGVKLLIFWIVRVVFKLRVCRGKGENLF